MTKLFISKNTEAKVIATIWNMGAESLNPDDYADLERILATLCCTRSIDMKSLGSEQRKLSGHIIHDTDCASNNPIPAPCNCE